MSMDRADFEKYIEVANDRANYAVKEFIAKVNLILIEDGNGYWADLGRKDFKANVEIRPNKNKAPRAKNALSEYKEKLELMKQILLNHGDLALDVLDIIFDRWLKCSNDCKSFIEISADEILLARGLKKKISGSGRRGGYTEAQRSEVKKMVDALSCL